MSLNVGAATIALGCASLLMGTQPVAAQEGTSGEVDPFNPLGHFIYPANEQGPQLLQHDKEACYGWASEETQFDPFAAYRQALEAQEQAEAAGQRQGEVVQGAAKGAMRGFLVAAVLDNDRSEGAARGAVAGGLISGVKRRRRGRAAQKVADEKREQAEALLQNWDRAYVVCLEGRKYSVG